MKLFVYELFVYEFLGLSIKLKMLEYFYPRLIAYLEQDQQIPIRLMRNLR